MSDQLTNPNGGGMTGGGTTAADNLHGTLSPGAGSVNGVPTTNDSAPADLSQTGTTGSVPSGGQKAVPDDAALAGLANDAGGFGDGDGGTGIDDGDTLSGDDIHPVVSASDTVNEGVVPTSGLSGGGTNAA